MSKMVFLNPRTCGIYKDGRTRYHTDHASGERTDEIDNELIQHVEAYLSGKMPPGSVKVSNSHVFEKKILVPTYFDKRFAKGIESLLADHGLHEMTLGDLIDSGTLKIRGGHGSPGPAHLFWR